MTMARRKCLNEQLGLENSDFLTFLLFTMVRKLNCLVLLNYLILFGIEVGLGLIKMKIKNQLIFVPIYSSSSLPGTFMKLSFCNGVRKPDVF